MVSYISADFMLTHHMIYNSDSNRYSIHQDIDHNSTHSGAPTSPHIHSHNSTSSPDTYYRGTNWHRTYSRDTSIYHQDIARDNNPGSRNTPLCRSHTNNSIRIRHMAICSSCRSIHLPRRSVVGILCSIDSGR